MGNYKKKVNRLYLLVLVVAYVAGMNVFVYLKMLGLRELSEVSSQGQEALLPLSTCMGLLIALGIAFMEFHIFNQWRSYSFLKFVLCKYSMVIVLITVGCTFVFIVFALFVEQQSLSVALHSIPDFLSTEIFLSVLLYLVIFSVVISMVKTIYDYLGPQAIAGALLGKYNQPAEEDLTFLFIDLQSSTRIAENLGHIQYSRFIERCFHLLTESIYRYNATIYQFVGDEAVLLWPASTAQKTLAPIELYFDFVNRIEQEREHFTNAFGEIPQFKAAVHTGIVTVTEIHTVKREIVYHGDVLNTCARMLEQCNAFKKNLIVSSSIARWLLDNDRFSSGVITQLMLRGKVGQTTLHEITLAS